MTTEHTKTGRGYRTGFVRQVWLHIATEGGRWTPAEIAAELGADPQVCNRTLHGMARLTKLLSKATSPTGLACFGVTADCKVPSGVTIKELVATGVAG